MFRDMAGRISELRSWDDENRPPTGQTPWGLDAEKDA